MSLQVGVTFCVKLGTNIYSVFKVIGYWRIFHIMDIIYSDLFTIRMYTNQCSKCSYKSYQSYEHFFFTIAQTSELAKRTKTKIRVDVFSWYKML